MMSLQIRVWVRVVIKGPVPQAGRVLGEKSLLQFLILWQSLQCMLQIGANKKLRNNLINESLYIEYS
jgi:hypothetical protein